MTECAVCKREMYDPDKGFECIGYKISLVGDHAEINRAKDMFGKADFSICFCCQLKSLGIKETNNG